MTYYLVQRNTVTATGNTPDFSHVASDEVVLVDLDTLAAATQRAEKAEAALGAHEEKRHRVETGQDCCECVAEAEEHARRLEEREAELENALKGLLCNHGHAGIICLDPHKHMGCMDECKAAREALKEKP